MKRNVITAILLIAVFIGMLIGFNHYDKIRAQNQARNDFLKNAQFAVDAWDRYADSDDILDYQYGVVNFYIAGEYYDRYTSLMSAGVTHEFMAINTIRIDMFSDMTDIKPYLPRLKEALAAFDESYVFGSHQLFLEIFKIEIEIQNAETQNR